MVYQEGDIIRPDEWSLVETLELWQCDPVKCVQDLIGNPTFQECISYVLEEVYLDINGITRVYDEMWSGQWWWKVQASFDQRTHKPPTHHVP
jgi:hypothetical protein